MCHDIYHQVLNRLIHRHLTLTFHRYGVNPIRVLFKFDRIRKTGGKVIFADQLALGVFGFQFYLIVYHFL